MTLRALLIGIDTYDHVGIAPLYGCLADVAGWLTFLERDLGCGPDDLRVLTSPVVTATGQLPSGPSAALQGGLLAAGRFGRADHKSILAGFQWLVEQVEAGHRGLLFYGGYGTLIEPARSVRGLEADARVRAIVPCDASLEVVRRRVGGRVRPGPLRGQVRPRRGLAVAASLAEEGRFEFPTVVKGAIPLPDRTVTGIEVPAGHALDKARDSGSKTWAELTVILDTSFTVPAEPPVGQSRSLPLVDEVSCCLPFYELSSRTICAARPGDEAVESSGTAGLSGAFSRCLLTMLAGWRLGSSDSGEVHVRIDHDTLHRTVNECLMFFGSQQRPTLMGAEHVGQAAFLCRGLDCECHDGLRNPDRGNQGQIDGGVSGFRAYTLRFEVGPGTGAGWHVLGRVLSAGSGLSPALVDPADPGKYPRGYAEGTEYWRFFDPAVELFYEVAGAGRLLRLELSLAHETQVWNDPACVQFVRTQVESVPRKRHCSAIPPWPPVPAVPPPGADCVALRSQVGGPPGGSGDEMVLRFLRDGGLPQVVQRLVWHHARPSQSGSPTFFGELALGSQPQVFTPVVGSPGLPPGRSTWYTADTALGKLPQDP